ncbi:MAG: DUF3800 domain-containing protein [candidate division Zixibacteria bacterium]|nr:DUF3800 domain-containing protein [candidate division Zixibacteria bacterium]
MACYSIYFDESGTDRSNGYVYVAGCMMEKGEWLVLDKSWQDIINKFEIKRFRASDCEAAKGEFNDWSRDCRNEIFTLLVDEINRHDCVLTWAGVAKEELNSVIAQQFPQLDISPYELCLLKCYEIATLLPHIYNIAGTIDLYFEGGQDVRQQVRRMIISPPHHSRWSTITVAFQRKENHTPYQVADLHAWELLKYTKNSLTGGQMPIRASLQRLAGYKPERFITKLLKGNDLKLFLEMIKKGVDAHP